MKILSTSLKIIWVGVILEVPVGANVTLRRYFTKGQTILVCLQESKNR